MERRMEYLSDRFWNSKKLQYEIGEEWKIKIWSCKERMRCEKEPCRIEDVDMNAAYGMAIQIVGGGRQSKRSIPMSKLEMIESNPKEFAEMLVEDAIGDFLPNCAK